MSNNYPGDADEVWGPHKEPLSSLEVHWPEASHNIKVPPMAYEVPDCPALLMGSA